MTYAFAGYYSDNLMSKYGGPLPGLAVTVKVHGSSTLATLYTDRTKATTTANPVSTDSSSNLAFYADPGLYDLYTPASGTGFVTVAVTPDGAGDQAFAAGVAAGLAIVFGS